MRRAPALALMLAVAPAVSGCAPGGQRAASAGSAPAVTEIPEGQVIAAVPGGLPRPGDPAAPTVVVPPGMQFLYGSGEGAALSVQAYRLLANYLSARVVDRKAGLEIRGVVLAEGATLDAPRFVDCGDKPLAAVFDVDETVLLNLGYEANDARLGTGYDDARWKRWEATGAKAVAAVPGAVAALKAARADGITIAFNSNRTLESAADTAEAIRLAGLGEAKLGQTLWLRTGGSGKDPRRQEIAAKYCVVAMAGDQLGDFSDLFNTAGTPVSIRRAMADDTAVAGLWGAGWFVLPNPVYGSGLKGDFDEVFPLDKRWTDPADLNPNPDQKGSN